MNQEIKYKLAEEDLLEFQMFSSAQSKSHRRQRLSSSAWVILAWTGLGFYFLFLNNNLAAYLLFALAVLWLSFGKAILKWRYERHFLRCIRETRGELLDVEARLGINENELHSQTIDGHGNVAYLEIGALVELSGVFLIKLKQGLTLIIPKRSFTAGELDGFTQALSAKTGLPVQNESNYRWK